MLADASVPVAGAASFPRREDHAVSAATESAELQQGISYMNTTLQTNQHVTTQLHDFVRRLHNWQIKHTLKHHNSYCMHSMQSRVYVMSDCLSHQSTAATVAGGFAAKRPVGKIH